MELRGKKKAECEAYRLYFKEIAPYIRFYPVIRKADIHVQQSNFSQFLSGKDNAIKIQDVRRIARACKRLGHKMGREEDFEEEQAL